MCEGVRERERRPQMAQEAPAPCRAAPLVVVVGWWGGDSSLPAPLLPRGHGSEPASARVSAFGLHFPGP